MQSCSYQTFFLFSFISVISFLKKFLFRWSNSSIVITENIHNRREFAGRVSKNNVFDVTSAPAGAYVNLELFITSRAPYVSTRMFSLTCDKRASPRFKKCISRQNSLTGVYQRMFPVKTLQWQTRFRIFRQTEGSNHINGTKQIQKSR